VGRFIRLFVVVPTLLACAEIPTGPGASGNPNYIRVRPDSLSLVVGQVAEVQVIALATGDDTLDVHILSGVWRAEISTGGPDFAGPGVVSLKWEESSDKVRVYQVEALNPGRAVLDFRYGHIKSREGVLGPTSYFDRLLGPQKTTVIVQ
jgi:hypothetical protein